jgi:hypothetical protein
MELTNPLILLTSHYNGRRFHYNGNLDNLQMEIDIITEEKENELLRRRRGFQL